MADEEFLELTEEEAEYIKARRQHFPVTELPYPEGDPRNPNPGVSLGPRLRPADALQKDFEDGVKAKGQRFIARVSSPKKDPIKEGASDRSEARYNSRMSEVLEEKRRQKTLAGMDFSDWGEAVALLRPEDWTGPTVRKSPKWRKKWEKLEPIRLYAVGKLDAMPVGSPDERKAKMGANLECMRILGRFSKGVIDAGAARTAIDAATR